MSLPVRIAFTVGVVISLLSPAMARANVGTSGQAIWLARYDGPDGLTDFAQSIAVSRDGTKVFVTGCVDQQANGNYGTEAYDSLTGTLLWTNTYDGSGGFDTGQAVAAGPDGAMVFVTGTSDSDGTASDFATLGIDAVTGLTVWTSRFDGPAHGDDAALAVSVSPDGSRVFVTGSGLGVDGYAMTTVAYDAFTGDELWVASYGSPDSRPGHQVAELHLAAL